MAQTKKPQAQEPQAVTEAKAAGAAMPLTVGTGVTTAPAGKGGLKAAARRFDPSKVEQFKTAILARDVEKAADALEAGVNPATPVSNDVHPLIALFYNVRLDGALPNTRYPSGMTYEALQQETSETVSLLLDHGVKLVESQIYMTKDHRYLVDQLLESERYGDLANIVVQAIAESLETHKRAYEPNIDAFMSSYLERRVQPGSDIAAVAASGMRHFLMMHNTVRQCLENPETPTAKKLMAEHGSKLGYWTEPFDVPPLNMFLPSSQKSFRGGMHENFDEAAKGDPSMPAAAKKENKADVSKYITVLPKRKPEDVLRDIDALVGLESYKEMLASDNELQLLKAACSAHGADDDMKETSHMVLTGNPGTGKTTLARLDAEYRYAMGLGGPKFAEVSRSKLMKDHIGGTDVLIQAIIDEADAIFIDEAPTLIAPNGKDGDKRDFGNRIVEAVIPAMENKRGEKTFYLAGYTVEMNQVLAADGGMRDRIGRFVHIPDPTRDQLGQAMETMLPKGRQITYEAKQYALDQLMQIKEAVGAREFGNNRSARKIVERLPRLLAKRLFGKKDGDGLAGSFMAAAPSKDECFTYTLADVKAIDFKELMGLHAKEAAQKIVGNDNAGAGNGSGYSGTRIGFTARL